MEDTVKAVAAVLSGLVTDEDVASETVYDVLADKVEDLDHHWENHGYDECPRWGVELSEGEIEVDVSNFIPAVIPEKVCGTRKGGGCDGEHRGKCGSACKEWEVSWKAVLDRVDEYEDGRRLAVYDIR